MNHRSTIAAALAFTLVAQTAHVARADERVATPEDAAVVTTTPFWVAPPTGAIDVGSRLALAPTSTGVLPKGWSTSTDPAMSNNAKTVLIVAIIAGAVLLVVGVIVIGKPFHKP